MGSSCSICRQALTADDDVVHFPWLATLGSPLDRLSDASCHFGCLAREGLLPSATQTLLDAAGLDGERPNGDVVATLAPASRMKWSPRWSRLTVFFGPLLLVFSAPRRSLQQLCQQTVLREAPGIGILDTSTGPTRTLIVSTCGEESVPSAASPATVQRVRRSSIDPAAADAVWSAIRAAVDRAIAIENVNRGAR